MHKLLGDAEGALERDVAVRDERLLLLLGEDFALAPRATLLRQDEGVDPVAPRVRGQLLERRPRLLELCTKGEARVRVAGG